MAKYNHQPFEDWMIDRETITPEQELDLQDHLQQCEDCWTLSEALRDVDTLLKAEPIISPTPGFSARWQAHYAEARTVHQKRQTYIFVGFVIGGALVLLFLLGFYLLPVLKSPYPLLLAFAYQAASTIAYLSALSSAVAALVETTIKVVPPTLWMGVFVGLTAICALWVVALQKLLYPRRIKV